MAFFNVMLGAVSIREHTDRGSGTIQYILADGEILVHNLSQAHIGFHVNVDGTWRDIYTFYSDSLLTGDGRTVEVWKIKEFGELLKKITITSPTPPKPIFRFAVFYHNLDWNTWYWDNNNGQDYFLQST